MSNKVIEADANKAIVDEFLNAFSTGDVPRSTRCALVGIGNGARCSW